MIDTTYVRATVCPVCGRQVKIYSKTWLADRQKEVKTLARLACKNCNKKEEVAENGKMDGLDGKSV